MPKKPPKKTSPKESPAPRLTWQERSDRLSGIRRDPATGVVIARESRHPLADLFRSAPMGQGLPGMNIPAEAEHILAIHIFDNLNCSPPRNPKYKARKDKEQIRSTGIDGVKWVPTNAPDADEDADPEAAADDIVVADISGYNAMQLEAMKAQIREEEIKRKLAEQADPVAGEPT